MLHVTRLNDFEFREQLYDIRVETGDGTIRITDIYDTKTDRNIIDTFTISEFEILMEVVKFDLGLI